MTNAEATPSAPVIPSSGTASTVSAYPPIVHAHNRPVRSANGPKINRSTRAAASPTPVTSPTTTAEAPSDASRGPVTDRAPS